MKRLAILLPLFLLLGSCDPNRVFEENVDLENAIWKVEDKPEFEFLISDVSSRYNLHLNLRNTLSYPFNNIYIKYNLRDSIETLLSSETLEFHLFDPKTGEPQGDGMGDLFDNRFPLIEDYSFNHTGTYTLDYEQYMRVDSLPMIVSVGLRIEQVTED